MGFDMYWATPATEEELAAAAQDDDPEYFRMSMWGWLKALTAMYCLGMVNLEEVEDYLAPVEPGSALGEVFELWTDRDRETQLTRGQDTPRPKPTQRRCKEVAAEGGDGDSGGVIPLHKLGTNDGLLVTREEIERTLASYDAKFPDRANQPRQLPVPHAKGEIEIIEWWGEWVDWLRDAARHDGFRVF